MAGGEIKPRYGFATFCEKQNGWADQKNKEACQLDALLHPSIDGILEFATDLPATGNFAGQQFVSGSNIYTWNGVAWDTCPVYRGIVVWNRLENAYYNFNDTIWQPFLNSAQISNYIQDNLGIFYGWSSGTGAPTAPPVRDFPFYIDTATDDIYIYNYNSNAWYPLNDVMPDFTDVKTGIQGEGLITNSSGCIDNDFLEIFDSTGRIDCSLMPNTEDYVTERLVNPTSVAHNSEESLEYVGVATSTITKANFSSPFVVGKDGVYSIKFQALGFVSAQTWVQMQARVYIDNNIATSYFGNFDHTSTTGTGVTTTFTSSTVNIDVPLTAGQTIDFRVFQINGTSSSLTVSDGNLSITKIREI